MVFIRMYIWSRVVVKWHKPAWDSDRQPSKGSETRQNSGRYSVDLYIKYVIYKKFAGIRIILFFPLILITFFLDIGNLFLASSITNFMFCSSICYYIYSQTWNATERRSLDLFLSLLKLTPWMMPSTWSTVTHMVMVQLSSQQMAPQLADIQKRLMSDRWVRQDLRFKIQLLLFHNHDPGPNYRKYYNV